MSTKPLAFISAGGSLLGAHAELVQVPFIEDFILRHGPNEWNHLPEDELHHYLANLVSGPVFAITAEDSRLRNPLIGVVTYEASQRYPQYQPPDRQYGFHGYISEVVVHRDHVRKGLGSKLVEAAIADLVAGGMREIYAKRHADNEPSARMMEKAGMVVVDEFPDPEIRPNGSSRTAVTRFMVANS